MSEMLISIIVWIEVDLRQATDRNAHDLHGMLAVMDLVRAYRFGVRDDGTSHRLV